jgi:hypothetical protein
MRWLCLLATLHCGSPPSMDTSKTKARESSEQVAAMTAIPAPCEPLPPVLSSYDAIVDGLEFTLVLAQDERGVWLPVPALDMPSHHASSIDWSGDAQLEAFRGSQVHVVAVGLGRTKLEHDPARGVWFATYAARIERACLRPPTAKPIR